MNLAVLVHRIYQGRTGLNIIRQFFNYHELAHHAHILMLENMAVKHVKQMWISMISELQDDSHGFSWQDDHGILPLDSLHCSRGGILRQYSKEAF